MIWVARFFAVAILVASLSLLMFPPVSEIGSYCNTEQVGHIRCGFGALKI